MNSDYKLGWIHACEAMSEALYEIAPDPHFVLLANYQVRNALHAIRQQVSEPEPARELTEKEKRLKSYGIKP